ncbi:hypothetical protein [Hymenobacter coalescens]
MPLLRVLLAGSLCLLTVAATAQTTPGKPGRPPRGAGPSAWRNQPPATAVAPPLSRQDRRAYENCPSPQRYSRKHRRKLVRIW